MLTEHEEAAAQRLAVLEQRVRAADLEAKAAQGSRDTTSKRAVHARKRRERMIREAEDIHTYIHTYRHACMHPSMHEYMHTCIHACLHTHTHTQASIYLRVHVNARACMCVCSHLVCVRTGRNTFAHLRLRQDA